MEASELEVGEKTPMMRQYLETKAQYPDAILFFRLGDFYEMFFEDAVRAAEILNITLTSRSKGGERIPMCGVPYHSAKRYVARLIEAGLKVAICEQVEEPNGRDVVRREVIRVVTPGMVLDEDVLEEKQHNFLAALKPPCADGDRWGLALLEASTGEFLAASVVTEAELIEEMGRHPVKELLVPEAFKGHSRLERIRTALEEPPFVAALEEAAFEPNRAGALLKSHLGVASLDGYGLSEHGPLAPAVGAAGAALRYLKDTQKTAAAHVDRIALLQTGKHLVLDEVTRANLELLRTLKDGTRKGSLLSIIDRTATAMGARRLTSWLLAPLRDVEAIEARLDAVEELSGKAVWRDELNAVLKEVGDIERLTARLALGCGNARDLKVLGRSLLALPRLAERLLSCESALTRSLLPPLKSSALEAIAKEIDSAVVDEPPVSTREGGLFKQGYHAELDALIGLSTSGKDFLLQIESREKERTGIQSLKVRFNKVFGYYIEVTKPNLHLVPKDYVRKQTTVGAERFVTAELKEYEEKVLSAEEKRCSLEAELFEALCARVVALSSEIKVAASSVATLDVLLSFARCAAEYGYCRPAVDDSDVIDIEGGRHPVVERMLKGEVFVPNDVHLDRTSSQILVITGPNMAGKSTVMRQVALTVLLAQAGSFVPAKRARIGVCDRLFTRVGASDNLARGQSTFMVEMTETSNILHHATKKSLVVLDEIGRGTSTFDGLSIAWAVAEHLHDRVGARTLFATHYHELTDLAREKPRVKNCSVAVKEHQGRVVFLRKLVPGGASRSYGIEVARLAGLPPEVVARAKEILANLESGELDDAGRPTLTHRPQGAPTGQLTLFASEPLPALSATERQVLDELAHFAIDATTPLEALNALARWKNELAKKV